jgi:hypothetical protein
MILLQEKVIISRDVRLMENDAWDGNIVKSQNC